MSNYARVAYQNHRFSDYPLKFVKYLQQRYHIQPGRMIRTTIADVGCGRGEYVKAFGDIGFNAHGYDRDMVAKETYPRGKDRFHYLNFEDPSQAIDRNFDVIFMKSVIEHVREPEELLHSMYNAIYDGGRIIITTPDFKRAKFSFWGDYDHKSPFVLQSLRNILETVGFEDIEVERFYQVSFIWRHPWAKPFILAAARLTPMCIKKRWPPLLHSNGPVLLGTGVKRI